eukprot:COSAG02_NODE_1079_length_14711_cov_86.326512_14_plen_98_part_00
MGASEEEWLAASAAWEALERQMDGDGGDGAGGGARFVEEDDDARLVVIEEDAADDDDGGGDVNVDGDDGVGVPLPSRCRYLPACLPSCLFLGPSVGL